MSAVRRLWFVLAMVGVIGAISVFLGAVYGGAGISVDATDATGDTPTNTTANCDDSVVRLVTVSVEVSRSGVRPQNPQWWEVGIRVRASAFETTKHRTVTLAPGGSATVTIPFTHVREKSWAPSERVDALVQVVKGNTEIEKQSLTASFQPVKSGENC